MLPQKKAGSKKALHLTMITTYGIKRNAHSGRGQSEVTMDDLFGEGWSLITGMFLFTVFLILTQVYIYSLAWIQWQPAIAYESKWV